MCERVNPDVYLSLRMEFRGPLMALIVLLSDASDVEERGHFVTLIEIHVHRATCFSEHTLKFENFRQRFQIWTRCTSICHKFNVNASSL